MTRFRDAVVWTCVFVLALTFVGRVEAEDAGESVTPMVAESCSNPRTFVAKAPSIRFEHLGGARSALYAEIVNAANVLPDGPEMIGYRLLVSEPVIMPQGVVALVGDVIDGVICETIPMPLALHHKILISVYKQTPDI
jgi:hypothetical protein